MSIRNIVIAAVGLVFLLWTAEANAQVQQIYTAGDLYQSCQTAVNPNDNSANGAIQAGMCYQFFNGYIDGFGVAEEQLKKKLFCMPSGVTSLQIAKMYIKMIDDHPDFMNGSVGEYIGGMIAGAFPCKP